MCLFLWLGNILLCMCTTTSLPFICPWVLQARILKWVAMHSSRGSSWPRDGTRGSSIAGGFFTTGSPGKPNAASTETQKEGTWRASGFVNKWQWWENSELRTWKLSTLSTCLALCISSIWLLPSYFCNKPVCSEKAMALHSSTHAWKTPWAEEPGGL